MEQNNDETHESSDDEEWYKKMEDAANSNEEIRWRDESNVGERFNFGESEFNDDKSYFDAVNDFGSKESGMVLPETDPVWALVSRIKPVFTGLECLQGTIESDKDWRTITDWLFSCLPYSSKLHGMMKSMARRRGNPSDNPTVNSPPKKKHAIIWADDMISPSVALCITECSHDCKSLEVTAYANRCDQASSCCISELFRYLFNQRGYRSVMFCGIERSLIDLLVDGQAPAGNRLDFRLSVAWMNPGSLYSLDNGSCPEVLDLPRGYEFGALRAEDAALINDTWRYRSDHSLDMVEDIISRFPAVGIFFSHATVRGNDDKSVSTSERKCESFLVSWCLTYDDGALGMLYTLPEHRGKRLATFAVRKLLSFWSESSTEAAGSSWQCAPFAYVMDNPQGERTATDTNISARLFTGLGFRKVSDCCWCEIMRDPQ